ncbi:MAG: ATP-dependent DNA helicase [Deltaproteobacteria bacterium]|nr:ATP-dependent DNA helicase [Deltaproteobacteria bacterium]
MEAIFGKHGLLAGQMADFEYRPMQARMAGEVQAAIAENSTVIIEAGTGTGKTLAYLAPAVLSGRKTVVSTGTITLQDQLLEKDIPLLSKVLGREIRAVCVKGRKNYLCLYRFHRWLRQPELLPEVERSSCDRLVSWVQSSQTGDRTELDWLPEEFAGWEQLTASTEQCLGQKCEYFSDCFLTRLRQAAAVADLVIVNHHLFFADLAVRAGGYGQVLPSCEVTIFDEAHLVEEIAAQYFSCQMSSHRLAELLRDIAFELNSIGHKGLALRRSLQAISEVAANFFQLFPAAANRQRINSEALGPQLRRSWSDLASVLQELAARLFQIHNLGEGLLACHDRCLRLGESLAFVMEQKDKDHVYWYERRARGTFLWASPIVVAPILEEHLFCQKKPYIFTSATLAVAQQLRYFSDRLGLAPETTGLVLDTPFSYDEQALLYLPKHLPLPESKDFIAAAALEIEALLDISGGSAFVLFTSFRNLREVQARLAALDRFQLLVQGEQPKAALLRRFRRETGSVLLGTASFWQGVDMPGETLKCVIIDKLPFAVPDDPLVAARVEKINANGGNAFWEYQVPSAVLTLRQGLGRLIRRRTDRGIMAILDSRLFSRSYGRIFLRSLPDCRITHQRQDIVRFLAKN